MINPFNKLIRSKMLPSGGNITPFMISNGILMPNGDWSNAQSALQNSDIYAVVNRISSDIALMKWLSNEPFLSALKRPSKLISEFSFWQSVIAQMLLSGNAYVVINDNQGLINGFELVPTSQVQVILADDSADISYRINFNDERPDAIYSSDEMLHFRCFTSGVGTISQYIGVSPLMSLVNDLNIQDYSKKLTLSTLKNAIKPSIKITVPDAILDKSAKQNIRNEFEEQTTGENAGRALVLDQSAKVETISIQTDVANFLNNANFSQTQIAKAFGISDSYLNGAGDAQSSVEMIQSMYFASLQTYIASITSELSLKFNTDVGLDVRSITDPSNQQLIDNLIKLSTGSNPAFAPNEVQEILKKKGFFD